MSLPFKFGAEISYFYMYFCLKMIFIDPSFFIFLFLPSDSNFFKKSLLNLKIKNSGLNIGIHTHIKFLPYLSKNLNNGTEDVQEKPKSQNRAFQ